ncbi:low molecular weight protein-tyrosine-phosphatase [Cytophagaceae bacterium DM2B3-1]|uniref:protein-tyrosine-phosphatase n=1 Tax=Xanthocytophaga flava TaxID=3048013 RepID=A0ABT7CL87_9BACT|nr:low molecular weight protein-tyrosine-phosphatase [Xanthocytophaga flavus]MDJ1468122.1 low molecular weight protein-tyrosine-phosphatase [Xanthocytophaga flavus]MDJ1494491.1 low molecular weight protein-tyrosine-phosphatase [Xanthocytophaga flavus]
MVKILFVCLGNICRSPLAEGIFNHLVVKKGLQNVLVSRSAGTADYHIGEPADRRTIKVARKHGIEIHHEGSQLSENDFQEYDYIVAMDHSNYLNITRHPGYISSRAVVVMMRNFDTAASDLNVPDPYFGSMDGFERVYHMLMKANEGFIEFLTEKHHLNKTSGEQ